MNSLFYDGFNSKLIETAFFESFLEIPVLESPQEIVIPTVAVPFSKRNAITKPAEEMLVFYEQDPEFREFVSVPQSYIDEIEKVKIISTPDCSLYRDMPLWEQLANIGVSRSVGYYLQQQGKMLYLMPAGAMKGHTQRNCLILRPPFPAYPKTASCLLARMGAAEAKRINTSSKQDLRQC